MDDKQAAALRAPFPKSQIGKLPRAGIQLDYVGHAAVTSKLLEVDPLYTWEPIAVNPDGSPALTNVGLSPQTKMGLWIRLTVAGVTRPGFGDGNSIKECISDAIRNAAMRFGVALDLWAKEDLHAVSSSGAAPAEGTPKPKRADAEEAPASAAPPANGSYATEAQRKRLFALAKEHGVEGPTLRLILQQETGQESTAQIPRDKYDAVCAAVQTGAAASDGEVPFE